MSKPPAERNAAAEDQVRKRIDAIKAERDKLQEVFNQKFPSYAALSRPQPVSLKDTQALLANDEVLIVFDFDAKSYAWVISMSKADWVELKVTATESGVRGDTASGSVTKAATLETGMEIRVPLFIKEGEKIKVHTETREFAGRA